MREAIKLAIYAPLLIAMFPVALLTGWGRIGWIYRMFAQFWALIPGVPGNFLRMAYYKWTLEECFLSSRISFGTFFAHPQAKVGRRVYIGPYCVLGRCSIGDQTQIAAMVQILSGAKQHRRGEDGRISGGEEGVFETIAIGPNCWIGASAILMAAVGEKTTIGAGSVVTKPVPPGVVAVGNPARVIRSAADAADAARMQPSHAAETTVEVNS